MAIFAESRYENADVVPVQAADGVYRATVISTRTVTPPSEYTTYRVITGDTLWKLAAQAYDDAELWWAIADANPELFYPDQLTPGQLLKIPVVVGDVV